MATTHSIVDADAAGIDYLAITDASQTGLDITGSMTGMGWLRPRAIGRIHTIFGKYDSNSQRGYIFLVDASNKIAFTYSEDGLAVQTAASAAITGWAVDKWFHLAAVFIGGTPEVQFYLNGLPFGSAVAIAGPGTIFNNTASFRIGNYQSGIAANNFRGHLDQVKIYDDERTAAEIFAEYQNAPVSGSNLQGGWNLDNVLTDISGNANTLTNTNTSFVEGEIHGFDGNFEASLADFSLGSGITTSTGGGGGLTFRMRGFDQNGSVNDIVFWDSAEVDSDASDYSGSAGPVVDIVVHKLLGA